MAGPSKIEWTERTWNPIVGCSVLTPGCTNCYAMKMAARIEAMKSSHYDGTTKKINGNAVWTGKLALAPEHILLEPLRRRKPTTYFVNSMGDLFHEDAPDEWIDKVFAVTALCPQHTFQVLTKRAERMREYFATLAADDYRLLTDRLAESLGEIGHDAFRKTMSMDEFADKFANSINPDDGNWPLKNVWLGVSAERQKEADERIPHLLQAPAAIRFVSAEPLLGPIDLSPFMWPVCGWWRGPHNSYAEAKAAGAECGLKRQALVHADARFIDWVIVGGESGPGARPMHPDWARKIIADCEAAGVAKFFKQWGSWYPIVDRDKDDPDWRADYTRSNRLSEKYRIVNLAGGFGFHGERVHLMQRYSKAAAGRLLDGKEHNDMPLLSSALAATSNKSTHTEKAESIG